MQHSVPLVGKRAPGFTLQCTRGDGSGTTRVSLDDFMDRWLLLVFYPRDFSLICPTELTALSSRVEEFEQRGCDLLAISTDSIESHERWIGTPRAHGGLGPIRFPLASDVDGEVSRAFGVFLERQRVSLRGLFIVDPNGVVQFQVIHNLTVGRRTDEILRVLAALETGGMCAEGWCPTRPTLDPTEALSPGRVVAHYRIEGELGAGGFGVVYRAYDQVLQRLVAIKLFKPGKLRSVTSVLAEARAAAALNHPNICTVFAIDDSEGVPVIAMEFVPGRPLSRLLDDGPLAVDRVARIGRQVASGMAAAHARGIVHRDLKPSNILIAANDVVKVTDFGLSQRHDLKIGSDTTQSFHVEEHAIVGTPTYMSPEQVRREAVTAASDVFAFGLVVYEMLTGERALQGDDAVEVFRMVKGLNPDALAAKLPAPYAGIVRKAIEPNLSERSLTMQQIAVEFEAFEHNHKR